MKLLWLLVALPVIAESSVYSIKVSITETRLELLKNNKTERVYRAGTVKHRLPRPVGNGQILAIQFNPNWNPMPDTVKMYREQKGISLPATVPFGHKEHPLGPFKMILSHHSTKYHFSGAYSIHGTNNESSIGGRVSGGCVRLSNKEGLELAKTLHEELKQNRTISVFIEE